MLVAVVLAAALLVAAQFAVAPLVAPAGAVPRMTYTPAPTSTTAPTAVVIYGPTLTPGPTDAAYPVPVVVADAPAAPAVLPRPPVVSYIGGRLLVSWSGGALHEATGLRPLWPAPLLCRASPCSPAVPPGTALMVIGPGGESAVTLVPPPGDVRYLPVIWR